MAATLDTIYDITYTSDRAHHYEFRVLLTELMAGKSCISIHPLLSHRRALFVLAAAQSSITTGKIGVLFTSADGPSLLASTLAARIGLHIHTIRTSAELRAPTLAHDLDARACQLLVVPVHAIDATALAAMALQLAGRIGWLGISEAQTINQHSTHYEPRYEYVVAARKKHWPTTPVLMSAAAITLAEYHALHAKIPAACAESMPLRDLVQQFAVIDSPEYTVRLAWLVKILSQTPTKSVVFCASDHDAARMQRWLIQNAINAVTLPVLSDNDEQLVFNQQLTQATHRCIVASGPLPDWVDTHGYTTVIHFDPPERLTTYMDELSSVGGINANVSAYIRMTPRERLTDHADAIEALTTDHLNHIIQYLQKNPQGVSSINILNNIMLSDHTIQSGLAHLLVQGCVSSPSTSRYTLGSQRWDATRHGIILPTMAMLDSVLLSDCMSPGRCIGQSLGQALGDNQSAVCGVCTVCTGVDDDAPLEQNILVSANSFVKKDFVAITPKTYWPAGAVISQSNSIPNEYRAAEGKALCIYDDPVFGKLVRTRPDEIHDELIEASVSILRRWLQQRALDQKVITTIPARPHKAHLLAAYAQAIASELGIPYIPLIVAKPTLSEQSRMTNQLLRAANTYTGYEIRDECHGKQIILFDDYVDSGWSMTTAAFLLQKKGSGTVHPFAFALKGRRGTVVH